MTIGTQKGSNYGKVSVSTTLPKDVTDPSITWTVNSKNVALAAVGKNASPSQGIFKAAGESVTTKSGEALALKGLLYLESLELRHLPLFLSKYGQTIIFLPPSNNHSYLIIPLLIVFTSFESHY